MHLLTPAALKQNFTVFVLLTVLLCCSMTAAQERSADPKRPNIVLILADDMGFGDIGANGATRIETPNIDAIAKNGVNFSQFYASANVCTPSRAGLMTGRYPIRTQLGYDVLSATDDHGLPQSEETMAASARERFAPLRTHPADKTFPE